MTDGVVLSVEMPDGRVEELNLPDQGAFVIGRDPRCHVVLPSPEVSRRHLTVEPSERGFKLTDQSANGTLIGEQRVVRQKVDTPPGVPLRLGPYVLRLRRAGEPLHDPSYDGFSAASASAPGYDSNSYGEMTVPPQRSSGPPPVPGGPPPVPGHDPSPPFSGEPAAPEPERRKTALELFEEPLLHLAKGTSMISSELRRRVHRMVLDHMDLANLDRDSVSNERAMRPKLLEALGRVIARVRQDLPPEADVDAFIGEIIDEALGLGPLERLLSDEAVSEIMVVHPSKIYIERKGKLWATDLRFTDDDSARACIERIVTPLGRRIDEMTPLVDARLKDGSRVNAVIRPIAIQGACITIRKFKKDPLTIEDLIGFGSMNRRMATFLERSVTARKNVVISGGTGSGKTTLLNVLSASIPGRERVVTIEDAAELRLEQPHVVSLETRPANMEGRGEYTIRDLVKNALRMRPDRIVVGECRGGEALDMLQAMNTGHEGSMTTTHANSPDEALKRLETLSLMSGLDLPSRAIREQIASSVHLIVQQTRFSDGSRRVSQISELSELTDEGMLVTQDIFRFVRTGTGKGGKVEGEFRATGYLPSYLDEFIVQGLVDEGGSYI